MKRFPLALLILAAATVGVLYARAWLRSTFPPEGQQLVVIRGCAAPRDPGHGGGESGDARSSRPRGVAKRATDGRTHRLDEMLGGGPVLLTFIKKGCPCSEAAQSSFNYTLEDCPKADVLMAPGGSTRIPLADPAVVEWVKEKSGEAEVVVSVCTGAPLLAKDGLLDGLDATTHKASIEALREAAPKAKVKEGLRFADNGKVVTSAGVSAGIDASLHVVERLLGPEGRPRRWSTWSIAAAQIQGPDDRRVRLVDLARRMHIKGAHRR